MRGTLSHFILLIGVGVSVVGCDAEDGTSTNGGTEADPSSATGAETTMSTSMSASSSSTTSTTLSETTDATATEPTDPDSGSDNDSGSGEVCGPDPSDSACWMCNKASCCETLESCAAVPDCACYLECLMEIPVPNSRAANGCLIECMADVQPIATLLTDMTSCQVMECGDVCQ